MKIEYTTGCTYNDLYIDNTPAGSSPIDELKEICKKLIDENNDSDSLQQIIIDYLYQVDRAKLSNYDSWKCETCGDYVEIFELDI